MRHEVPLKKKRYLTNEKLSLLLISRKSYDNLRDIYRHTFEH